MPLSAPSREEYHLRTIAGDRLAEDLHPLDLQVDAVHRLYFAALRAYDRDPLVVKNCLDSWTLGSCLLLNKLNRDAYAILASDFLSERRRFAKHLG